MAVPAQRQARRGRRALNPVEARKAIYIDFEGQIGQAPVLLGILSLGNTAKAEDSFRQVVLDREFQSCAEEKGLIVAKLESVLTRLVRRLQREGILLVAWSEHELHLLEEVASDVTITAELNERYRNAILTAERWRRASRPDATLPYTVGLGHNTLINYLRLIDYPVPTSHGPGKTGARISDLRKSLRRHEHSYRALPPGAKRKWTNLLKQNRLDCEGMRTVMIEATAE